MVAFQSDVRPNRLKTMNAKTLDLHHHQLRMSERAARLDKYMNSSVLHLPFGSPSLVHVWSGPNVSFELMKQTFVVPKPSAPLILHESANAMMTTTHCKNGKIILLKRESEMKRKRIAPETTQRKEKIKFEMNNVETIVCCIRIHFAHIRASPWAQVLLHTNRRMQTTCYENIHQV